MAWVLRSRAILLEPPADSPSTINNSDSSGLRLEQSASFPGKVIPSNAPFLNTVSLAARAAFLALAVSRHFSIITLASAEFFSKNSLRLSPITASTAVLAGGLPNRALVCPSNCGSLNLTETIATNPSLMSSPIKLSSASFK